MPLVPDPAFGMDEEDLSVDDVNDHSRLTMVRSRNGGAAFVVASQGGVTLSPTDARRAACKLLHFAALKEAA